MKALYCLVIISIWNAYGSALQEYFKMTITVLKTIRTLIASQKNGYSKVHGVPDIMFYLPEYYNAYDCKSEVEEDELHQFEEYIREENPDNVYTEYFEYIIDQQQLGVPCDEQSALQLFQYIVSLQL